MSGRPYLLVASRDCDLEARTGAVIERLGKETQGSAQIEFHERLDKMIVSGESQNLRRGRSRRPYLPLKEALPPRDWVQGPGGLCIQSETRTLSTVSRPRSPLSFCANGVAERELPVPI